MIFQLCLHDNTIGAHEVNDRTKNIDVLALDLEGTLISNAVSQIPRPGLHMFLLECAARFPRVVMFTTVPEARFRAIARTLADEGAVPAWFADIEYVHWQGPTKDLRFIADAHLGHTVLVDDCRDVIHPAQVEQWVPAPLFRHPYAESGRVLQTVLDALSNYRG